MLNVLFFDTETTGNTEADFLCQLAYKTGAETFSALYKPEIRIPPEASAVHHITNKMIDGKPAFRESDDFKNIQTLFEDASTVVVAHNALFDLMMLKKEGIKPKRFICTLRVARHLDPEEKISSYRLQYLRYFLDIDIEAAAHDAMGDVLVLEELFKRLEKKIMETEGISEDAALERMIEISSHPSVFKTIRFGKYNGRTVADIAKTDRGYLEWLLAEKMKNESNEEDWIYTLKQYLGKL